MFTKSSNLDSQWETEAVKDEEEIFGLSRPALYLLLTILIAYPIGLFHRIMLFGKPPGMQHMFFILCGFFLGVLNFGWDMLHTAVAIIVVYIILKTIGGTLHSVVLTFSFTMGYLLVGYYKTATQGYDIVWTMPFCILVLRLSGLAFDLYDGSLPEDQLSSSTKEVALREVPSLIEVAAFTYFPTSFLVGPQFPMRKYKDFVAGKLKPVDQEVPQCVGPAMERLTVGIIYSLLNILGRMTYSDEYFLSREFSNANYFVKLFNLGIWGHITLYKYIACWTLVEGSCILIGLGYNGDDECSQPKWNGCSNVDILLFEKAQNFHHDYIASFNINTNHWVFCHIYKRLKFLGNRLLSQIGVLLFLSLWHGYHSGYFACFAIEFFAVYMEKDYLSILKKNKQFLNFLQKPIIAEIKWVALKLYTIIFMGPCMVTLVFLSFDKWWHVFKEIKCIHLVLWIGWLIYRPLVVKLFPPDKEIHVD